MQINAARLVKWILIGWALTAAAPLYAGDGSATTESPGAHDLFKTATALLLREASQQYPQAAIDVQWQPLPTVMQNKPCGQAEVSITGSRRIGRIPVRVRCSGSAPWAFFISADVSASQHVVVAARAIPRGTTIQADMLRRQALPLKATQTPMTQIADVVGQQARRNIPAGRAVQLRYLSTPHAVNKGEQVVIRATVGAASITTVGVALDNGHVGEQISVRNLTSKRVIRPWVLHKGVVSTRPI